MFSRYAGPVRAGRWGSEGDVGGAERWRCAPRRLAAAALALGPARRSAGEPGNAPGAPGGCGSGPSSRRCRSDHPVGARSAVALRPLAFAGRHGCASRPRASEVDTGARRAGSRPDARCPLGPAGRELAERAAPLGAAHNFQGCPSTGGVGFPRAPAFAPSRRADAWDGWDAAATQRIEELPQGGTLIVLDGRCSLVIAPMSIVGCWLGRLAVSARLFRHMRPRAAGSLP